MHDKRVLITGATSGIGKEAAFGLAALGTELILAVRDVARGKHTAQEIEQRTGAKNIVVMHMDTSSQHSIRAFVDGFRAKFSHLDVLINNAAMNRGALPRHVNENGIEVTFATNVLGYFLLTALLRDMLSASAPSRIINVASQFASDLDLDDLQFERRPFEAAKAYAQSKACDRLLTWAMARRLKHTGVTVNAMTPGLVVETGLYRHSAPGLVERLRQYSDRTSAIGADTLVWLASSDEVAGIRNRFYLDRKKVSCQFRDKATEEKLWRICEQLTGTTR